MRITKFFPIVFVFTALSASISSHAASLVWTNGNGNFNDASRWSTGTAPVAGDDTDFTNNTSYTVTLTASTPSTRTNAFDAKSGTVTINASGFTWSASDMFSIGHSGHATATVFVAGGTLTSSAGALRVGDSDVSVGTLVITNGSVSAMNITVGATFGASGSLVISGPGALNGVGAGTLFVGNNGSTLDSLTISNGGHLAFTGGQTLIGNGGGTSNVVYNVGGLGASSSASHGGIYVGDNVGSGFNTMIVTNATLISNNGTVGESSSFNTVKVLAGGTWNLGAGAFRISTSSTGNVVIVDGGLMTNIVGTVRLAVNSAFGNSLTLQNGAKLFCTKIIVGDGNNAIDGSNNVLNVGGPGLRSFLTSLGNQVVLGNGGANGQSLVITNGTLFNNGGPLIGNGTSNNTCTILAGGVFDSGSTAIQVGYNNAGFFQTAGNVLTVGAGGIITNGDSVDINPGNSMNMLGGIVSLLTGTRNVFNQGTLAGVGTISPGSVSILSGATFAPGNPGGTLFIANDLTNAAGSTTRFSLGASSSLVVVGTNLTLDGTLSVVDSGGLANGTYTLYTYGGTGKINPSFALGTLPGTFSGMVSNDSPNGRILLILTGGTASDPFTSWQTHYFPGGGPNAAPNADPDADGMSNTNEFLASFSPTNSAAYLHVINIVRTNNDIQVTYLGANGDTTWSPGISARTNVLEFTTGTGGGSYSTNSFVSTGMTNILSGGTGAGLVTNMLDVGGATNSPSRYYRVRVLLP